jgi:hypothetical protein
MVLVLVPRSGMAEQQLRLILASRQNLDVDLVDVAIGGGSPGGPDTAIQYNVGGAFAGSADFTWDETTQSFLANGAGPTSSFVADSFGSHSFTGTGPGSQFNAAGHENFIVPSGGGPAGSFVGSGYQTHNFTGDGSAGAAFIGLNHAVVDMSSGTAAGNFFRGNGYDDHQFQGNGGGGDFDASNHRSFLCTSSGVVNSRFDIINHLTVNFEGPNPLDPTSAFIVDYYRNFRVDFSGATYQQSTQTIEATTADTVPLVILDNSAGLNGAAVQQHSGNRDPNGVVTAPAGSTYQRSDGTLYVNTDGAQAWANQAGGGVGAPIGKELFPTSLISVQNIPWSGAAGGFGELYLSSVLIETTTSPINTMFCLCSQLGGVGGGLNLGIYSAAGLRLAYGAITPNVLSVNSIPLTTGGGLVLTAGNQYFFAVFSNQNGSRILGGTGLTGVPAGTNLGFHVPNATTQPGGAGTGMPSNVSGFFGTQTTERYYAGARN